MKKTNNKMACGICGREFNGKRGIAMHIRRMHPEARNGPTMTSVEIEGDKVRVSTKPAKVNPEESDWNIPDHPAAKTDNIDAARLANTATEQRPIWARLITDFEGAVVGAEQMKLHAAHDDAREFGSESQWNKVIDHQLDHKRKRLLLIMEMLFGRAKVADRLERELLNDCQ